MDIPKDGSVLSKEEVIYKLEVVFLVRVEREREKETDELPSKPSIFKELMP